LGIAYPGGKRWLLPDLQLSKPKPEKLLHGL
jgi:hypothetical protein